MSVERGKGVIFFWNDVREDQLENVESWTEAAQKIREITGDVKKTAIAMSPVGRGRADQFKTIKGSHYQAAGIRKVFGDYQQVVGNSAPHAEWVHEGTLHLGRFPVVNKGNWMGPVEIGADSGKVSLTPGPRQSAVRHGNTARWRAYPTAVYFQHYLWRGQDSNNWLARAGGFAYNMPGNH
jgi:hypothetical protein